MERDIRKLRIEVWTPIRVDQPTPVGNRGIVAKGHVSKARFEAENLQSTSGSSLRAASRVILKCDVGQVDGTKPILHAATYTAGRVAIKYDICKSGMNVIFAKYSATFNRRVALENDVCKNGMSPTFRIPKISTVIHTTAKGCFVVHEDHIGHAGTPILVIQTCPCIFKRESLQRFSTGDRKAIQDGALIHVAANNHMIGVIAVIPFYTNITAQDRGIGFVVPLDTRCLCTRETTIDCHTIFECKRNRAIRCRGRLIGSRGYPDLIAVRGFGKSGLQIGVGIFPGGAVVRSIRIPFDVMDLRREGQFRNKDI